MEKISNEKAIKRTPAVQVVLVDGSAHFFTTLKAIYSELSPVQVGIGYRQLTEMHLKAGETFRNGCCTISKIHIIGLKQKKSL